MPPDDPNRFLGSIEDSLMLSKNFDPTFRLPEGREYMGDIAPQEYYERSKKAGHATHRLLDEQEAILKARGIEMTEGMKKDYKLGMLQRYWAETDEIPGGTLMRAARKSTLIASPIVGGLQARAYKRAVDRHKKGESTDDDLSLIAEYEALQNDDARRGSTILGAMNEVVASAPAIVGEMALGTRALSAVGAPGFRAASAANAPFLSATHFGRMAMLTPLTPSMYVEGTVAKNIENGRDPLDIRGFGQGMAHAYANMLVLGRMQAGFGNVKGLGLGSAVRELGTKGAVGTLEQGIVDSATNLLDTTLPKNAKLSAGYGTFENLMEGRFGEAGKQAAVQMFTFSMFAGIHRFGRLRERSKRYEEIRKQRAGREELPIAEDIAEELPMAEEIVEEVGKSFGELFQAYHRAGNSPESAFEAVNKVTTKLGQLIHGRNARGSEFTLSEARNLIPREAPPAIRRAMEKFIDSLNLPEKSSGPRPEHEGFRVFDEAIASGRPYPEALELGKVAAVESSRSGPTAAGWEGKIPEKVMRDRFEATLRARNRIRESEQVYARTLAEELGRRGTPGNEIENRKRAEQAIIAAQRAQETFLAGGRLRVTGEAQPRERGVEEAKTPSEIAKQPETAPESPRIEPAPPVAERPQEAEKAAPETPGSLESSRLAEIERIAATQTRGGIERVKKGDAYALSEEHHRNLAEVVPDSRIRSVLTSLLEGSGYEQAGRNLGVSRQRAKQIADKALEELGLEPGEKGLAKFRDIVAPDIATGEAQAIARGAESLEGRSRPGEGEQLPSPDFGSRLKPGQRRSPGQEAKARELAREGSRPAVSEKLNNLADAAVVERGLSPETESQYRADLKRALSSLSDGQRQAIAENVDRVEFFGSTEALTLKAIDAEISDPRTPAARQRELTQMKADLFLKGEAWAAAYSDGVLYLDGESLSKVYEGRVGSKTSRGQTGLTVYETYLHELGHALDGKRLTTSNSTYWKNQCFPEFRFAEGQEPPLTRYAAEHPAEALAEFFRSLHSGRLSIEEARARFPRTTEYFEDAGWLPQKSGKGGEKIPEVFTDRVEINSETGSHVDLGRGAASDNLVVAPSRQTEGKLWLKKDGKNIGYMSTTGPQTSESSAARRMFPEIVKEGETAGRIVGIEVKEKHQGKGYGQWLYLEAANRSKADWLYNSQAEPGAVMAKNALAEKGWIELHWKGEEGGVSIYRITPRGREALKNREFLQGEFRDVEDALPEASQPVDVPDFGSPESRPSVTKAATDQRPKVKLDARNLLPRLQDYGQHKQIASEGHGFASVPVIGKYLQRWLDPGRADKSDSGRALVSWSASRKQGRDVAGLWAAQERVADQLFAPDKEGAYLREDGTRGRMADDIEAEMKKPGSVRMTPEQRAWVRDVWEPLLKDAQAMLKEEGITHYVDSEGNEHPINKVYFPRLVIGKKDVDGKIKSSMWGSRKYESEAEGSKTTIYEPSAKKRVADFIEGVYRTIANKRLANDAALEGKTVEERFDRLKAENADLLFNLDAKAHKDLMDELKSRASHPHVMKEKFVQAHPAFRGKIFPAEVADKLEKVFAREQDSLTKKTEKVTAGAKSVMLGGDFSYAFVQLLPTLFRYPGKWAASMYEAMSSLGNKDRLSDYLKNQDNAEAARDLSQLGTAIGRPEDFMAGSAEGEWATRLPFKIGRFYAATGRAYSTAMAVAKIELWKALKRTEKPENYRQLAESIDAMLLSGRMEGIGLTPLRQAIERILLLAPSYYRGGLNAMATAFMRGVSGKELRTMLGAFATVSGVLAFAGMKAAGLSEDEIKDRFNPWKGKFLRVPIQLSKTQAIELGFSNIMTSYIRLAAQGANHFISDKPADTGAIDNPILRWLRGHAGFAPRLAADLFIGRDYFGNRLSPQEAAVRSIEPILFQQLMHGEGGVFEKGLGREGIRNIQAPKKANVADAVLSVFGFSSYPGSEQEARMAVFEDEAKKKYNRRYGELSIPEQAIVTRLAEKRPDLPQKTASPRQIEAALVFQQERVKSLTSKLSKQSRKKLDELGHAIPAYHSYLTMAKTQVSLTDRQLVRYEELLAEEYEKSIGFWNTNNLKSADPQARESFLRRSLTSAKERANARLIRESKKK